MGGLAAGVLAWTALFLPSAALHVAQGQLEPGGLGKHTPQTGQSLAGAYATNHEPLEQHTFMQLRGVNVEQRSPIGEILAALVGAVVGFVLFFIGFPVVYLNEQREVKMWELFGRAEAMCLTGVDTKAVDPGREAFLVHMVGSTSTADTLADEDFGVQVTDCAKLKRVVEMYQWKENKTEEKRGDQKITTYSYEKVWSSTPIDSSEFHDKGHDNPKNWPLESALKTAEVKLGAFTLTERLVAEDMQAWEDCTPLLADPVRVVLGDGDDFYFQNFTTKAIGARRSADAWCAPSTSTRSLEDRAKDNFKAPPCSLEAERYLVEVGLDHVDRCDSEYPIIGDVRVHFGKVPCGDCTVVALQHGSSFAPLLHKMHVEEGRVTRGKLKHQSTAAILDHADDDDAWVRDTCCGCTCGICGYISEVMGRKEVYELVEEKLSAAAMFERAQAEHKRSHTFFMYLGWGCFVLGLALIFNVIPVALATLLRLVYAWNVSDIVEHVGRLIMSILALVLGSMVFLLTYAASWCAARPIKAGVGFALVVGLAMVPFYLKAEVSKF